MQVYLQRLVAICLPEDDELARLDRREMALESLVQLLLTPGVAAELFVNYDCDPYCSNLFEDICKMLAKNVYPVAHPTGQHVIALDALLAVLHSIAIAQCTTTTTTTTTTSSSVGGGTASDGCPTFSPAAADDPVSQVGTFCMIEY